jgi:hypothetical protein
MISTRMVLIWSSLLGNWSRNFSKRSLYSESRINLLLNIYFINCNFSDYWFLKLASLIMSSILGSYLLEYSLLNFNSPDLFKKIISFDLSFSKVLVCYFFLLLFACCCAWGILSLAFIGSFSPFIYFFIF